MFINRLHRCCLRNIYNDKTASSEKLLEKTNSISIHHRNTQTLTIEMYKVGNWLPPEIMNELFELGEESHCNLRC